MMQTEVSKFSTLKVKVAFLAALTAGLVSGVATPASAVLAPAGGGDGSFSANLPSDTCLSLPAQIRGLEKSSCR